MAKGHTVAARRTLSRPSGIGLQRLLCEVYCNCGERALISVPRVNEPHRYKYICAGCAGFVTGILSRVTEVYERSFTPARPRRKVTKIKAW